MRAFSAKYIGNIFGFGFGFGSSEELICRRDLLFWVGRWVFLLGRVLGRVVG